jgi:hypothetical protein
MMYYTKKLIYCQALFYETDTAIVRLNTTTIKAIAIIRYFEYLFIQITPSF